MHTVTTLAQRSLEFYDGVLTIVCGFFLSEKIERIIGVVQIVVNKEYYFTIVALLDSGADSNCIQEGLIPAKYYEKTTEGLSQASGTSLSIDFGLPIGVQMRWSRARSKK